MHLRSNSFNIGLMDSRNDWFMEGLIHERCNTFEVSTTVRAHVTCECVYMHDVCVLYMRSFWLACISDIMCKVCLTGASKGLRATRLRLLCFVLRCDTGMMLSIRDAVSCIPVCLLCGMVRLIQRCREMLDVIASC